MAKITLTKNEFQDFVVAYIFHKIHKDEIISSSNEDFENFIERLERMGMGSISARYYIGMDPKIRRKFRRIKSSFSPGENSMISTIVITSGEDE